jgi:DNA-binding transcriptional LysR family regulator
MEFHQLRSFVATAEELSITAAARRVHLSQPALSRQIQSLEEELGVALFDRVKQRIHLTAAGRFFLDRARQILCDAETSSQQVREQFGDGKRTIRLGFLTIFLDDLVAPAVKALRKSHPRGAVALYELSPQAQIDRLRNDELDLALLGNLAEEDRSRFAVRSLMRNAMAAVLPEDHRLARRRQLDLKELAGDPFVSLSDAVFPGRRQFLRGICRMRGFEPDIAEECDSLPLLLAAVSGGAGVALLPAHSAKLPHSGSVFVRLKAPLVHAEVMAVHKPGAGRGALAALIEHLGMIAGRMK